MFLVRLLKPSPPQMRPLTRDSAALFDAVKQEDLVSVGALLDSGLDPNIKTYQQLTPLHFACTKGNDALVRLLLSKGAGIEDITTDGFTPLMRAVYYNRMTVVQTLVESGAQIDYVSRDGKSALILACFRCKPRLISYLVYQNADVQSILTPTGSEYSQMIKPEVIEFVKTLLSDRLRLKALWMIERTGTRLPPSLNREVLEYL